MFIDLFLFRTYNLDETRKLSIDFQNSKSDILKSKSKSDDNFT